MTFHLRPFLVCYHTDQYSWCISCVSHISPLCVCRVFTIWITGRMYVTALQLKSALQMTSSQKKVWSYSCNKCSYTLLHMCLTIETELNKQLILFLVWMSVIPKCQLKEQFFKTRPEFLFKKCKTNVCMIWELPSNSGVFYKSHLQGFFIVHKRKQSEALNVDKIEITLCVSPWRREHFLCVYPSLCVCVCVCVCVRARVQMKDKWRWAVASGDLNS